jgi:RNA polymerase sigma factor (sigma-70 family)
MKELNSDYEKLYSDTEIRAINFYKRNYKMFESSNYDVDDLKQEVNLRLIKIIKKYENVHQIKRVKKLANQAVTWFFKDLIKKIKNENSVFDKTKVYDPDKYENEEFLCDGDDSRDQIKFKIPSDYMKINDDIIRFTFGELHIILSDREFSILKSIFKDGKNTRQLAKEQGCSNSRVRIIYQRALDKTSAYLGLKKY